LGTRVLRRPIVFLRVRSSILILLIKTLRCNIRSLYHTPLCLITRIHDVTKLLDASNRSKQRQCEQLLRHRNNQQRRNCVSLFCYSPFLERTQRTSTERGISFTPATTGGRERLILSKKKMNLHQWITCFPLVVIC
jgi:hypothetical protein